MAGQGTWQGREHLASQTSLLLVEQWDIAAQRDLAEAGALGSMRFSHDHWETQWKSGLTIWGNMAGQRGLAHGISNPLSGGSQQDMARALDSMRFVDNF